VKGVQGTGSLKVPVEVVYQSGTAVAAAPLNILIPQIAITSVEINIK
jgi:hypothetical protein